MRALTFLLVLTACAAPAANEEEPLIVAKPVEPAPRVNTRLRRADKVVVMPLKSSDAVEGLDSLGRLLVNHLHESRAYEVVTPDDIGSILGLERLKDTVGCDDVSCASDLAGALDAPFVLTCVVDQLADRFTFNLTLIDAREVRVVERAQVILDRNESLYDRAMRAAVARLLGDTSAPDDFVASPSPPPTRRSETPPIELNESVTGPIFIDIPERVTVADLLTKSGLQPIEWKSRYAEATLLARWTRVGFEPLDRAVVGKPAREKLAAFGAVYWIVGEASASDGGTIMGTQMHSYRSSVTARVIDIASGKVIATASGEGTVGHMNLEAGIQKSMDKAATRCSDNLLSSLLEHLNS